MENNTVKNNKAENTTAKSMWDRALMEQIQKEDAVHYAAMRRRAEVMSQDMENHQAKQNQEFEHRRLMLGLDRFHELEISRMRRQNDIKIKAADNETKGEPGDMKVEGGPPNRKELGKIKPGSNVFKQVSGDGGAMPDPLYLRVEWVDSDCGGFFKWEHQAPTPAERDGYAGPNGEGKVDRKGKMKESRDDPGADL